MKRLPPDHIGPTRVATTARPSGIEDHSETQALIRRLDKIYERVRNRARAEWLRSCPRKDPSDGCVSVRVECNNAQALIQV